VRTSHETSRSVDWWLDALRKPSQEQLHTPLTPGVEGANEAGLLQGLFKNLRFLDKQPPRNAAADSLFSPI